jgi:WD40 repeat protein
MQNAGMEALKNFENQEIEALEKAITSGDQIYNSRFNKIPLLRENLPSSPLLALQTIVTQIHEKNRITPDPNIQNLMKAVSFSPGGDLIATGGKDNKIRLWELSGKFRGDYNNSKEIISLEFNPDGKQLAVGGENGSVKILQIPDLTLISELTKCHRDTQGIRSLSFSEDGKYLVTGGGDKVCLWNLETGNKEQDFDTNGNVYSLNLRDQTIAIAIAGTKGSIELKTLEGKSLISKELGQRVPFDISFNSKDTKLATAEKNGKITLWNWQENNSLNYLNGWDIYKEPDKNPYTKVDFFEDNLFAVYENKDLLKLLGINLENESKPEIFKEIALKGYASKQKAKDKEIENASFNLKTNKLITVAQENQARLWDFSPKSTSTPFSTGGVSLKNLTLRSDNNSNDPKTLSIVTLDEKGNVQLWSIEGREIPFKDEEKVSPSIAIGFTPESDRQIVSVNKKGVIDFLNLEGVVQNPNSIPTGQDNITSIAIHPSKKIIATGDKQGAVTFWNYKKKPTESQTMPNPNGGEVKFMSFSPNGQQFVSVGSDSAKLWNISDLENPKEVPLEAHDYRGGVSGLDINENGDIAMAATEDSKIYLFDRSGRSIEPLNTGYQKGIIDIGFGQFNENPSSWLSSARSYLATVGDDRVIKIWDYSKRQQIAEFTSEFVKVNRFSFSPDGRYIVVEGDKGKIEVFSVQPLHELLKSGCDWLDDYHSNPSRSESEVAKTCSKYVRK